MPTILITGAAGFIASSLADKLLLQGRRVVAVDNLNGHYNPATKRLNVRTALQNREYIFYEADIRDLGRMHDILCKEKPQTVVHIAGATGMKASFVRPEVFFSNNVTGTRSVLEASRLSGCSHLVFASTASVYGDMSEPARENFILPPPANPYVATKRIAEEFIRDYAENHGIGATILRLCTVYGPRQRSEMAISKFVRQIECGLGVDIYGDGTAQREYLYIDDCADALIQSIEKPFMQEIFNIGGRKSTTLNELIAMIELLLEKKAKRNYVEAPEGIPSAFSASIEKAKTRLAFEPKVDLRDGLELFIAWYRVQKSNYPGRNSGENENRRLA
jgi:UDP-glucuronate 4-epimerase